MNSKKYTKFPNHAPITRRRFVALSAAGLGVVAGATLVGCSASVGQGGADQGRSQYQATGYSRQQGSVPSGLSQVFMTSDISPTGVLAAYKALGFVPAGNVAVKLSTGEPGGKNFLQPSLIADVVQQVGGTIVECNTAYGGPRANTSEHLKAAADHGFSAIANVDIMDAEGQISLPVKVGRHLRENLVGSHFKNYDSFVSLAHFKGHIQGGFGGAVKNCSIGIASSAGKLLIHSAGVTSTEWGSPAQDDFLESMAEATKAVSDQLGGNICYVNVMNKMSVDCDCSGNPAAPDMADIGVLASLDPVALDKACVDLVYAAPDGASVIERIESRNGSHTLDYAEKIGLGNKSYELVLLDA